MGFHALRHHLDTQVMGQVNHRAGNHCVVVALGNVGNEGAVDLQQVHWEIPQVTQRRVTHAEVINGQVHAQLV